MPVRNVSIDFWKNLKKFQCEKKEKIGRISSFGTRLGIGLVQILVLANL